MPPALSIRLISAGMFLSFRVLLLSSESRIEIDKTVLCGLPYTKKPVWPL